MKKFYSTSLFILILYGAACGQTGGFEAGVGSEKGVPCPKIDIANQTVENDGEKTVTYDVALTGENIDRLKIVFNWNVEGTAMLNGQGTSSAVFVLPENPDAASVRLVIYGLSGSCPYLFVGKPGAQLRRPLPELFEEIPNVGTDDLRQKIDRLSVEIEKNPDTKFFIVNYGVSANISEREKLIRYHLTFRKINVLRVIFVNGGIEKTIRTRIWKVPPGADATVID
jgi:hypothetical protein